MSKNTTTKSTTKIEQPIGFTELMGKIRKESNFITPSSIEDIFDVDQLMVRRHLRAHFTEPFNHEHGTKWQMDVKLEETKKVVQYFYERFKVSDDIVKTVSA